MSAKKLTGKDVAAFMKGIHSNEIPEGMKISTYKTSRGQFDYTRSDMTPGALAQRYNEVKKMIIETGAKVEILPDAILINYSTGAAKMGRNIMTDKFLIPMLELSA